MTVLLRQNNSNSIDRIFSSDLFKVIDPTQIIFVSTKKLLKGNMQYDLTESHL